MNTTTHSAAPRNETSGKSTKDSVRLSVAHSWGCPLYKRNDVFELNKRALLPPPSKSTCLILADTCMQKVKFYSKQRLLEADLDFMCGGCDDGNHITVKTVKRRAVRSEVEWMTHSLHQFSFFRIIPEEIVEEIYDKLAINHYHAGETIIVQGEKGRALYIVVSGEVEVLVGKNNVHVAHHGVGGIFGEMSLLSGNVCNASIKATTETRLLTIYADIFESLLERFPSLQRYFYRLLSNRLNKTNLHSVQSEISEIHGNLSEWSLPDLLQTINMNKKSGALELHFSTGKAVVEFVTGNISDTHFRGKSGSEAFYELFTEPKGDFNFIPSTKEKGDTPISILGDFMSLMMEGLVRADEADQNRL